MNQIIINATRLTFLSLFLAGCQCLSLECDVVLAEETMSMPTDGDAMQPEQPMSSADTQFEVRNSALYATSDSGALVAVPSKSLFGFDQASLTNAAKRDLNTHASYLRSNRSRRVTIEGHTDERGTNEYNLALGDERAMSVADYLRTRGVSGSQIRTVSYGEERPLDNGSNERSWANNRRVKIVYQ